MLQTRIVANKILCNKFKGSKQYIIYAQDDSTSNCFMKDSYNPYQPTSKKTYLKSPKIDNVLRTNFK